VGGRTANYQLKPDIANTSALKIKIELLAQLTGDKLRFIVRAGEKTTSKEIPQYIIFTESRRVSTAQENKNLRAHTKKIYGWQSLVNLVREKVPSIFFEQQKQERKIGLYLGQILEFLEYF